MRVNPKVYELATGEPKEVQEVENHKIEIYCLDDYPQMLEEFTRKGKFAVWSSVDGENYRLFIEKGYHETLKDLYGKRINAIWVKFWDECEKITNKFSRRFVMPLTALVLILYFVLSSTVFTQEKIGQAGSLVFALGMPGVFIIIIMTLRRYTNNRISMENVKSIDEIKRILGADKFNTLLEAQRSYLDHYFGYDAEDMEEAEGQTAEVLEEPKEVEIVEEATEEKIIEVNEEEAETKKEE